ncbi:MAG: RagB/SusD family nutrient uptake outer membrane protein [Odoribacteraceae bacterium]|nr:RagB/SusD family nutrient uptake outer membrane protein [Odoribacteraceae bacterium]
MKYTRIFLLPALLLASCDLLDIQPVNRMVPVSVADYESVLLGGYPRTEFFMRTELCTDNVYANLNASNAPAAVNEPWFVWAATHLLEGAEDTYWNQLYSSIYYANSVLDEFNGREPEEDKVLFETVRGEALALRAYCYFYLVNLYAETHEEGNLDKPGVPMPLSAEDVHQNTQDNTRVPVGKVWEQIDADLEAAARDLAGKPSRSAYRFDYVSLQALRARVFLFTRRYDEAIAAAQDVISARPLFDMNTMQEYIDAQGTRYAFAGNTGFIDRGYKDEVLFFVGGRANTNIFYYSTYTFKPDPALLDLCYRDPADSTRDYRRHIFDSFAPAGTELVQQGPTVYRMFATQEKYCYYVGLKLSEAYVTRAEALARRGSEQDRRDAVKDLNALLATRYKASSFTPLTVADLPGDRLLARVLEERRLELAFDAGLRWLDLRRLGKPAITHVYKSGSTYTLEQGDPRYVLQIPASEQENSPGIPLNPR